MNAVAARGAGSGERALIERRVCEKAMQEGESPETVLQGCLPRTCSYLIRGELGNCISTRLVTTQDEMRERAEKLFEKLQKEQPLRNSAKLLMQHNRKGQTRRQEPGE